MFLYKSLSFRHEYGVLRLFYLISELSINNIMFIITMKFNGKNNTKNMPNEICGTWPACAQAHFSCHFHVFCSDRILLFFSIWDTFEREKKKSQSTNLGQSESGIPDMVIQFLRKWWPFTWLLLINTGKNDVTHEIIKHLMYFLELTSVHSIFWCILRS